MFDSSNAEANHWRQQLAYVCFIDKFVGGLGWIEFHTVV